MRKRVFRLLSVIILTFLFFLPVIPITPVYAISNPDDIELGTGTPKLYEAFTNVYETGDMLFITETYVHYVTPPTDYDASEAYLFEVLDTDVTTVLLSVPLPAYENKIVSIYQTPAQVTAAGLTSGAAYGFRLTGNPVIFASLEAGTNKITRILTSSDWVDQSTATSTSNPLRIFCINVAENLENNDSATYIVNVLGTEYLNADGTSIFLEGVPSLNNFVPDLLQIGSEQVTADAPPHTGDYAADLTVANSFGTTVSTGLTNLGTWIGVSQDVAGLLVLLLGAMLLCAYLYFKTQNTMIPMVIGCAFLLFGVWSGLMPLALMFVLVIVVVLLLAWFFLGKGAGI